jgi:phosphate transport system permease protein
MAGRNDAVFDTEEEGFENNLPRRHRAAKGWQIVLQVSTVVGIIVLVALVLNIIDGAFGYAAIQNSISPEELAAGVPIEQMLAARNTVSSDDDDMLATGVAASPYAIGLLGYADFQGHPGELRVLEVGGVVPTDETLESDAGTVVVSQQNEFVTEVTVEQLQMIFSTSRTWSDVDPTWPDEAILRYIPGADSRALGLFVESTFTLDLSDLPKEALVAVLEAHVSKGLFRRFESEMPFADRSWEDVYRLVVERVVEPKIEKTWPLFTSVLRRSETLTEAAAEYPDAQVRFVSWINPDFVASPQSTDPEKAGVRTAILGSLWTILITVVFAFPLGVMAAIYLEEYAVDNRLNRLIQTNISNLAGVPSIIYGMLGLAVFVRALEGLTSGRLFGLVDPTTANGRTVLAAGMTLGLLILPLIIINAQEAIKAVPNSLRQAGMGLGATRWQTIWSHVLPNAMPGILTGTILAISRAIGETAPLVVVGASTFITVDPTGPFAKFTTLPIQIYQWTSRPQDEFRNIAAAAILVLLLLLLTLNASAVLLRNRFSKRRHT